MQNETKTKRKDKKEENYINLHDNRERKIINKTRWETISRWRTTEKWGLTARSKTNLKPETNG